MAYNKIDWMTAKITGDNLNYMQTQYARAVEDAVGIRTDFTSEMRVEVVSLFPSHAVGRMIYHTGLKMFFYSTGSEWLINPKYAYFGNQANGNYSSTGNVTFSVTPGETVVRNYRNFTLNSGHTMTVNNPVRALIIRSWGDIIINGVLNMDYRGGTGARYITIGGVQYDLLGGLGGFGGGQSSGGANNGKNDSGGRFAGGLKGGGGRGGENGGQGGLMNTDFSLASHYATGQQNYYSKSEPDWQSPFSDGVNGGGGGGNVSFSFLSDSGSCTWMHVNGGSSGSQMWKPARGGGGGAVVRNGCNDNYQAGHADHHANISTPTCGGGAVVLMAMGRIIINGRIDARGYSGAGGGWALAIGWDALGGGGGGGCGGGRVILASRGTRTFSPTDIRLTGGQGGLGGMHDSDLGFMGYAENGGNGQGGSYSEINLPT